MEILNQIIIFVKKHSTKLKKIIVSNKTKIKEDLNLDSLVIMKIVIDIEDYFNITFDPHDFDHIETLGHLVSLVEKKQNL